MKRTTTIVLFASIFAVAVEGLGYSSNFATPLLVTAAPQSQEMVGMLGHVEYKVLDDFGNIKSYMQNDNIVVQDGLFVQLKLSLVLLQVLLDVKLVQQLITHTSELETEQFQVLVLTWASQTEH